jgi:hypothetical protein
MATATGEATAISVAETVREDRISDRARLAHGHSLAKPLGPAWGKELVTAIEEKHEQGEASEAQGSQRWRALDQLLRTSLAMISPAYLFNSFPEVH